MPKAECSQGFGVLRMGACDEEAQWVSWESAAIAHASNSGCDRLNEHEQAQPCWRGNTLWLEPCFQVSMSNLFKFDFSAEGNFCSLRSAMACVLLMIRRRT